MNFKSFSVLSAATVKNNTPPIRKKISEKVFHGLVASNFSLSTRTKLPNQTNRQTLEFW